jgi:hypothetical protein
MVDNWHVSGEASLSVHRDICCNTEKITSHMVIFRDSKMIDLKSYKSDLKQIVVGLKKQSSLSVVSCPDATNDSLIPSPKLS